MWTLLLSRQGDPPGSFIDRRQIDSGQIKVGRSAATCDLVVPDTAGHLSREHCLISAVGFDLFVVDTSTNGVSLNQPGQRIAPQTPVAVRIGDRLLIGDFAIEIASESAGMGAQLHAPAAAAAAPQSLAQPDAWFDPAGAADPIWGGPAQRSDVHDFLSDAMHDFLAVPTPPPGGGAGATDPFGSAFGEAFSKPMLATPVAPAPDAFAIPEDWAAPPSPPTPLPAAAPLASAPPAPAADPFAGFVAPPATWADDPFAAAPPARAADPFAPAEQPRGVAASAVDPFAMSPAAGAAPAAAFDPFADPPDAAPPAAVDPFAGFDAAGAAPAPPASQAPADDAAAPPLPGAADWAAFCDGAGVDPAALRTSPDAMRRLGVLYRQVVLGLSDLIQDRAAFKDEFRVERTQLSFGRNNPLKHLPPLDSAKLLLADPLPGFMDAEDAVRAGFADVKRHQLALLAGVQHALKTVFERLAPQEVNRVMEKARGGKRGLLGRGADPWSVYQAMWEALRTDATSNVNSVMSVAFREGYEAFLKTTPEGTR